MSKKTIVITEDQDTYKIANGGVSNFELIGILECLLLDLKSARPQFAIQPSETIKNVKDKTLPNPETDSPEISEPAKESNSPELRTRIRNAVKTIKALGGETEEIDPNNFTDEELQSELETLTAQYKRLKSSKEANK